MDEIGGVKFLTEKGSSRTYEACHPQLLQGLGTFVGEYKIHLKQNSVSHAVGVARQVPIGMREAVKREVPGMQRERVVRNVGNVGGPTE